MTTTPTPGYTIRLAIWFDHDKNGRKVAYYWSPQGMRAIRLGLAAAEQFIANDDATRIEGHPLKAVAR